jgi:predicted ribosomally synthesized peptide with SipW-like signal peptide
VNRKQLILIFASVVLMTALVLGGTYAWFTSRSSDPYYDYFIGYGGIGIEVKYASYTVKHDGDGVYNDYYDKDGSPIAMPTYIPYSPGVYAPWPLPTGLSATSAAALPTADNPNDLFYNRVAFIYPGSMFYDNGYPIDNARGVLEFYVKNVSSGDAIVRVNQKGVRFANQDEPKPDEITDVDFILYRIKNNFLYHADAPESIVNPNRQTPIPFINETMLRSINFSPYDIFNNTFYETRAINFVSKAWKAAYTTEDYSYTNPFGPDAFGLRLNARAVLDTDVKMAANANAECFYFYIPRDQTARVIYSFNALTPADTNSVVKYFTNEYQYSVLTLDTENSAVLEVSAVQPIQDQFEHLFGTGDSQTIKENFELTDWISRPKQPIIPRGSKTPSPTAAEPTRAIVPTQTVPPTPTPPISATPTSVPGLSITEKPTPTPRPTSTPTATKTPRPTPTNTPTPNCSGVKPAAPVLNGKEESIRTISLYWSPVPCANKYNVYFAIKFISDPTALTDADYTQLGGSMSDTHLENWDLIVAGIPGVWLDTARVYFKIKAVSACCTSDFSNAYCHDSSIALTPTNTPTNTPTPDCSTVNFVPDTPILSVVENPVGVLNLYWTDVPCAVQYSVWLIISDAGVDPLTLNYNQILFQDDPYIENWKITDKMDVSSYPNKMLHIRVMARSICCNSYFSNVYSYDLSKLQS